MKNLLFESILLVSHREKKAKEIQFHPMVTVIKGQNDTGKSSLIKSIYYALGAKPQNIHRDWMNADVALLLQFKIDQISYYIYRHRDSFSLFDNSKNLLGTYSSISTDLGPKLAAMLDFRLKLPSRKGESVTPPPAFLFLPFYIDQDKGWASNWSSFDNLGQFSGWRKPVINYHFGMRPDEWYQLDSRRKSIWARTESIQSELSTYKSMRDTARKKLSRVDFDIDVIKFKSEIGRLLTICESLRKKEMEYRARLVELRTEEIRLGAQIEIVVKTHDELSEDYKYAVSRDDKCIGCPTCGAEYTHSFAQRFDIAKDTETCNDLLGSLRDDLEKVNGDIESTYSLMDDMRKQQVEIEKLLTKKQGKVKLKDLVKLEGKKSLLGYLDRQIGKSQRKMDRIGRLVSAIEGRMKKLEDPKRKKEIREEYAKTLKKYTGMLDVPALDESVFKNISANIKESGSDLSRAILAYTFSVLDAVKENGNATFCPIVIDAPNQQEQDRENLPRIMNFLAEQDLTNRQMIIGLVDDSGVKFPGKTILLENKFSLLQSDEYEMVSAKMREFEAENLGLKTD